MSISERLLKARKTLNLTQADFASHLGIDRGYVSTLEHGLRKPSETLLKLIKHEYGISDTWLETGKGEMFISPEDTLKSLTARFGEQAVLKAFNFIMKEHGLAVAAGRPASRADTGDPELNRLIDTLYLLWSTGDDRLKQWASYQFDRAFPQDVIEEAQKKQKNTCQAFTG